MAALPGAGIHLQSQPLAAGMTATSIKHQLHAALDPLMIVSMIESMNILQDCSTEAEKVKMLRAVKDKCPGLWRSCFLSQPESKQSSRQTYALNTFVIVLLGFTFELEADPERLVPVVGRLSWAGCLLDERAAPGRTKEKLHQVREGNLRRQFARPHNVILCGQAACAWLVGPFCESVPIRAGCQTVRF